MKEYIRLGLVRLLLGVAFSLGGCASDDAEQPPDAPAPSCGDSVCAGTETASSCPVDCPSSTCGNGTCEANESVASCAQDCQPAPTCGDQTCSGSESCSSCSADCGQCPPALTFTWEHPILIDNGGGRMFPAYVAHLLGGNDESFPWEFHTACVIATNASSTAYSISVETQLVGYSAAASTSGTVPASGTARICADPVPNLTALYGLSSNTAGAITSSVKNNANQMVLTTDSTAVTILPGSDIQWGATSFQFDRAEANNLSAVFVLPHLPQVEALLTSVANRSAFTGKFGADPYLRGNVETSHTIPVGDVAAVWEQSYFASGEAVTWSLPLVDGGVDDDIDLYVFTPAEYDAWAAGTATAATAVWADRLSGASGTFTAPNAGWYVFVLFNTPDNFVSRQVTFRRTGTKEFVVRDVLRSIFEEMKERGMLYVSIPSTFFDGAQHIKRTDQILTTQSANCIDGTLLFASVAELIGMEPVLVYKTGHAYLAVRDAPGSPLVWPVETTMVNTETFWTGYVTGIDEFISDSANDPNFDLVDVRAQRQRQILPMPQ